jgi:pimeloyl-ACP methyl ester carboxylesterase
MLLSLGTERERHMPEIKINGYITYYEDDDFTAPWKPRDSRQTILIQHGFGRNSQFWRHWVPMLAGDYRVIRRDLRGHGGSGDPGTAAYPWSFDGLIADLAAFCDALQLDPQNLHVLGESTGGMLATGYATSRSLPPAPIRSLILCGAPTTIGPAEQKFFACGHASWQDALLQMGSEGWARWVLSQPGKAPRGDSARTEWAIAQFARAPAAALAGYSRVISATDVTPLLPKVQVPALVLAPTRSAATPIEDQQRIATALPRSQLVPIAGEGHEIYIDRPEECVSAINSFLWQFR